MTERKQQSKRRKTTVKKKQRLERLKKTYTGKLIREKKKPLNYSEAQSIEAYNLMMQSLAF